MTKGRKELKAAAVMQKIMGSYFYELNEAATNKTKKIAWCSSVGPAEILRALGFLVYFPENHGAMLGATRLAPEVIPYAVSEGYSPDICSYLTSDIGAYLKGVTPLARSYPGIEKVPRPDVLVYNTNQCRDVQDWFFWYGRRLKVPVLGIHTPRGVRELKKEVVQSVAQQMEELIPPLTEIAGRPFDIDELREVVTSSLACSKMWEEVLKTAAHKPSPLTFFDATIHMGPAVVLRGLNEAVDYYKVLLTELHERVRRKEGALEEERFRLYWEGMPIWGRLRSHAELFFSLKACVLASTYCNSWIFEDFDPQDPFYSMAKAYTGIFICRAEEEKERYLKAMWQLFSIDGVIYHDSKTCPNNANCRYGMPRRLEMETGVPALVINGDLNDLRLFSDEQFKTNVQAFIEQLEEKKENTYGALDESRTNAENERQKITP